VIIRSLLDKYRSVGGERRMKCGVRRLQIRDNRVTALELDTGETITADYILSSAGFSETMALCDCDVNQTEKNLDALQTAPRLSFVETMSVYRHQPQSWGWDETIVFFNEGQRFTYQNPQSLVDTRSGVICIPNNYAYSNKHSLSEGIVRITALANYAQWTLLPEEEYLKQKEFFFEQLIRQAHQFLPKIQGNLNLATEEIARDMFTPRTIYKYTHHIAGAVYGSPHKSFEGTTPTQQPNHNRQRPRISWSHRSLDEWHQHGQSPCFADYVLAL
jgi:phytoene dehydrogenase-like protein